MRARDGGNGTCDTDCDSQMKTLYDANGIPMKKPGIWKRNIKHVPIKAAFIAGIFTVTCTLLSIASDFFSGQSSEKTKTPDSHNTQLQSIQPSPSPTPQPRPSSPVLSQLNLNSASKHSNNNCFYDIPSIVATATDDLPFGKNPVRVWLKRLDGRGNVFWASVIDDEWIAVKRRADGRTLDIVVRTEDVIKAIFNEQTYGYYLIIVEVYDSQGLQCIESEKFNYVFFSDFSNLGNLIYSEESAPSFQTCSDATGLKIRNETLKGGFVPATIDVPFVFRSGIYIRGQFTITCENDRSPVGFELALCENTIEPQSANEYLAIIMPDGKHDRISIKTTFEKYGFPATRTIDEKSSTVALNGRTPNHFLIRIQESYWGGLICTVYIGRQEIDIFSDNPSCIRYLESDQLPEIDKMLVRLKAWQAGVVKIKYLEIGMDLFEEWNAITALPAN